MNLVIDASVFGKLFLKEDDSRDAQALLQAAIRAEATLLAPALLRFEMCGMALHHGIPFAVPLEILDAHVGVGLSLIDPSNDIWRTAETISRDGHQKSGFPSLEDSLYHALAIHAEGTFITADLRHLAKTQQYGHALALKQWPELPL